jgi:hypothetical protein
VAVLREEIMTKDSAKQMIHVDRTIMYIEVDASFFWWPVAWNPAKNIQMKNKCVEIYSMGPCSHHPVLSLCKKQISQRERKTCRPTTPTPRASSALEAAYLPGCSCRARVGIAISL